jgi:cytochrome c oxidase cbb3-type subunit 4
MDIGFVGIGFVRGILTAVLLVLFVVLCVWAWSDKPRADFDRAARLPFEDDERSLREEQC